MIRAEPLPRQTVFRGAAGRLSTVISGALAEAWALFADDGRAIRLKILLLMLAAVVTAIFEAPWP
ncbi:MAG: hypothetical protein ACRDIC_23855 [bacterium]